MDGLQGEYGDRLDFIYLNAEDGNEGAQSYLYYGLRGHPSFLIVGADGGVRWQVIGVVSEDELRAAVEAALDE